MSPMLKKFLVLALTGVVGAAVSSGLIPGDVGAFLAAHVDAGVGLVIGLVLPELAKK